ncbi:MAG: GntR family transcriptional regulator [Chloroflexi bacterium]|nr:GntR family transcriptional regulator [Chloroflexota bacterium]
MVEEASLTELPHKSLREAAYVAIRSAITAGELKPGQRLVEKDLALRLGISRAPVREALRQLETEGLVEGQAHRGMYVTELSAQSMWEVYTLRACLEGLAVRLVARKPDPAVVLALERLLAQMNEAAAADDLQRLSELDMLFHQTICEAAQHRRLLEAWQGMYAQVRMLVALTAQDWLPPQQVVIYHTEVVDAIRRGAPDEAAALLTNHILTVGERISAALGPEVDS